MRHFLGGASLAVPWRSVVRRLLDQVFRLFEISVFRTKEQIAQRLGNDLLRAYHLLNVFGAEHMEALLPHALAVGQSLNHGVVRIRCAHLTVKAAGEIEGEENLIDGFADRRGCIFLAQLS